MSLLTAQLTVKPATPPVRSPNRYQVLGELGRGGMGVVYKARDRKLDRTVALKVLPAEWSRNDIARRRFIREAHAASAIDHQNICTIYDIDSTANGRLFLVMACYDGETLKDRLGRGTLNSAEMVAIASQVTSALGAAHGCGIVHRDIKPGNIFLCRSGIVKVLDFGLARRFSLDGAKADGDGLDTPGRPFGTANYMAPERILDKPADPRSDIFSLGVVIYEMATGLRPFAGDSPAETVMNVLDRQPEPIGSRGRRSAELERIVRKALEKSPDDRYQTAAQMEDALRRTSPLRLAPHSMLTAASRRRSA